MDSEELKGNRTMPEGLTKLYEAAHQEVAWLHAKWKIFLQLFAVSAGQIDLLNRTAPGFFVIIERVLLEDTILSLGRLTDPKTTGQGSGAKENLSLAQLVEALTATEPPEFCESIASKVTALKVHCKTIRDWRNRMIAHSDLPTALRYHPDPLPGINRKMIQDALKMIGDILNRIQQQYKSVETGYANVFFPGDGDTLIFYLQKAEEYLSRPTG